MTAAASARRRPAALLRRASCPPVRRASAPPVRRRFAALAVALLLAGCASVPDHGKPVRLGAAPLGSTQGDLSDVRQLPGKPQPDATPDRIVQGFLAAAKSADGNHQIARDFLSDEPDGNAPSQTWDDTAGTRIIAVAAVTVVGSGRVRVTGRVVGRLAKDGSYAADGRPLDLLFTLAQVGRAPQLAWRITNPPPGVLLLADDFLATYRAVDLYFLSQDAESVVPDHRYLDVDRASLATELVRRLLAGASAWLAPGVQTAFPRGTGLRSNVVQASPGSDLTVDLSGQADLIGRPQAAQLAAQLVWTLRRFNVGIRVAVGGRPLEVPDEGTVLPPSAYSAYDPDRLVGSASGYFVAGGVLRQAAGPNATDLTAAPTVGVLSAALSTDGTALAVVRMDGNRRQLLIGRTRQQLFPELIGTSFTPPSWGDSHDSLITMVDGSRLVRVDRAGKVTELAAGRLGSSGAVTQARLSRDGTRLAVVAGGRLLVGVLGQVRSGSQLVGLRVILPQLTEVRDVAWADSGHLLVAGRLGGGVSSAVLVSDDGVGTTVRGRSGLPASTHPLDGVAAAPGRPDLVQCSGAIWQRDGGRWISPLAVGPLPGYDPFYPG